MTNQQLLGPADAKAKARVQLPDGRQGTLTYCPPIDLPDWDRIDTGRTSRYSSRARVRLDDGAYVSVDPDTLARVSDANDDRPDWEKALDKP